MKEMRLCQPSSQSFVLVVTSERYSYSDVLLKLKNGGYSYDACKKKLSELVAISI